MNDNVKRVYFGSASDRARAKMADALEAIAGNIRRGEVERDPQGFVLVLMSNVASGSEVLHVNMTEGAMSRASLAVQWKADMFKHEAGGA